MGYSLYDPNQQAPHGKQDDFNSIDDFQAKLNNLKKL
jgi:hypothetical protein